jgi:hypothetical protein
VFDVEEHERCGDDVTDAPRAEADVAQGLEGGLE